MYIYVPYYRSININENVKISLDHKKEKRDNGVVESIFKYRENKNIHPLHSTNTMDVEYIMSSRLKGKNPYTVSLNIKGIPSNKYIKRKTIGLPTHYKLFTNKRV